MRRKSSPNYIRMGTYRYGVTDVYRRHDSISSERHSAGAKRLVRDRFDGLRITTYAICGALGNIEARRSAE